MALSPTSSRSSSGAAASAKWVDLGTVSAVTLAVSGLRTLYTTGTGEFLSALRFGDTVVANDGTPIIIFEIAGLSLSTADTGPYGVLDFGIDPLDSYSRGLIDRTYFNNGANFKRFRSPPMVAGAFTATLAIVANPSRVLATPTWQANHVYAATTAIIAAGHYWDGSGGTSGGSTPDFAGHVGGSVVDGTTTWFDEGTVATTGSVHAYAEIVTPAVP